jgi:hypothetical protein
VILPMWIGDPDALLPHEGCVCDRLLWRDLRVPAAPGGEAGDDGQRAEDAS